MRLRLFNFAATLSLVLSVATAALWVRSHFVADQLQKSRAAGYILIASDHGAIAYVVVNESPPAGSGSAWRWNKAFGGSFGGGFDSNIGMSTASWTVGRIAYRQRAWWVGHWVIAVAAAIFPLFQLVKWWRERRANRLCGDRLRGQCSVCGYDLRATPDRCPECGTVPQPPHNPPTMKPTATAGSGAVE